MDRVSARLFVTCIPLLVVAGWADAAVASCAGPTLRVSSGVVAPGESVGVSGAGFGTDCNDTGGSGPPLGAPARELEVAFVQTDERVVLGSVDADDGYRIALATTVPVSAKPGPASVQVGSATVTMWIDGPPVAPDASVPATKPVTQLSTRRPDSVDRNAPVGAVAFLSALAGAGAAIAARTLRRQNA